MRGSLDPQRQILSSVTEFTVIVPPEGLPDGTQYYCAVRDPEDVSIDVSNRVAQTAAILTNIPGIWMPK